MPVAVCNLASSIFVSLLHVTRVNTEFADVLNRHKLPSSTALMQHSNQTTSESTTTRVLMYIFPRQFKLHNVFTSLIGPHETAHNFRDYTIREDEVNTYLKSKKMIRLPKRLRGEVYRLVEGLQRHHRRCPYQALLNYCCPVSSSWPARLVY